MKLSREGKFKAVVLDMGISQTGPNELVTVTVEYGIAAELRNGQWEDVLDENFQIIGYHYIEKRDGTPNEATIRQLKAALGWDGVDFDWFHNTDLRAKTVQITCEESEYNGKSSIKVIWLAEENDDGGGGVKKGNTSALKAKLGAALRSLSGAPAPAPKPPPPPAVGTRKAPPTRKPAAPTPCTEAEAFEAFVAQWPANASEDQVNAQWSSLVTKIAGADEPTPAQWGAIREAAKTHLPF